MQGGINATRMELLRLRRRLVLARRGHHLLKGKQDELLRRFLALLEQYRSLRRRLRVLIEEISRRSRETRAEASSETLRTATWPPPPPSRIEEGKGHILNLEIPSRTVILPKRAASYGPTELPASYDELSSLWREAFPVIVELGDREQALLLLADEIERTRRRVNALEYKLIPGLEEGIRTINFRLAEAELANITRLMRIQDVVRKV